MYIQRKGFGLMGLGDDAGCRTGPPFFKDGNWWVPIRDSAGKEYPLMQTNELVALPMCTAAAASSGGGWLDSLIKGATDVLKAKVTPGAVTNISSAPSQGMSTTTKVAIAGGVAVAALLIWKSRK